MNSVMKRKMIRRKKKPKPIVVKSQILPIKKPQAIPKKKRRRKLTAAIKRLRIRRLEAMPWTKKIYVFIITLKYYFFLNLLLFLLILLDHL